MVNWVAFLFVVEVMGIGAFKGGYIFDIKESAPVWAIIYIIKEGGVTFLFV